MIAKYLLKEIHMSNYCVKLDLPKVTEQQRTSLLNCWNNNINNVFQVEATDDRNDNLDIKKVTKEKTESYGFFYLYNWPNKKENIKEIFSNTDFIKKYLNQVSLQKVTCGIEPHSDLDRNVTLLCVLTGPAETVFYKTKNFVSGMSYRNKIKELEREETINLKLGHWYLFNTNAIHSVENPQKERFGVVIDLTTHYENFETALKKLTCFTY